MFVFLMVVVGLVCWIVSAIITNRDERKHRNRAMTNGYDSYADRNGILRRVDTNEPYWLWRDLNGSVFEINPYTREILKNLSAEHRSELWTHERERAVREGREVFQIEGAWEYNMGRGRNIKLDAFAMHGCYYMHVDTYELYVKRIAFGKPWYMGVQSKRIEFCDKNETKMKYCNQQGFIHRTIDGRYGEEIGPTEYLSDYGISYFLPGDKVFQYANIIKESDVVDWCVWEKKENCAINILGIRKGQYTYVKTHHHYPGEDVYQTIGGYYVISSQIMQDWIDTERALLNKEIEDHIKYVQSEDCDTNDASACDVYLNLYHKESTDNLTIGKSKSENSREHFLQSL